MSDKQQFELAQLRSQQAKTLQDAGFGGLSKAEQTEFDRRAERIHALERDIRSAAISEAECQSGEAEMRSQWNKNSETDTPQGTARQPYRRREKDSTHAYASSLQENTVKRKSDSEKKSED